MAEAQPDLPRRQVGLLKLSKIRTIFQLSVVLICKTVDMELDLSVNIQIWNVTTCRYTFVKIDNIKFIKFWGQYSYRYSDFPKKSGLMTKIIFPLIYRKTLRVKDLHHDFILENIIGDQMVCISSVFYLLVFYFYISCNVHQ